MNPGFSASRRPRAAFTLTEVLVAMGLMSLIVLVLMSVFSSTQTAFRSGVTQTDVLAGGRNTMEQITGDFRLLTASGGDGPGTGNAYSFVNLCCTNNSAATYMNLLGGTQYRTNTLQSVFLLIRQNTTWIGVGYLVIPAYTNNSLYPLYRYYATSPLNYGPYGLYANFLATVQNNNFVTNTAYWSHIMDGVVHFVVRAYDPQGYWITNGYSVYTVNNLPWPTNNTVPSFPVNGEVGYCMYSNNLPGSVDIQLGVLEDSAIRHLQGMYTYTPYAYTNYFFTNAASQMQLFRQHVVIPGCNPASYQ